MSYQDTYYIARIKKPHRKFAVGDVVVGIIDDGTAERMVCCGWSSKFNVHINWISLRFQGWNDWRENYSGEGPYCRRTGSGHLQIVGEVIEQGGLLHEFSRDKIASQITSRAEFVRQLSLFGGNMSGMVEAAATHRTK